MNQHLPSNIRHALTRTAILLGSAILLPHISSQALIQNSSIDRPEHPWLTPITALPQRTMAYLVGGSVLAALSDTTRPEKGAPGNAGKSFFTQNAVAAVAAIMAVFLVTSITLGAPINISTLLLAAQLGALTAIPIVKALGVPELTDKGFAARYRLTRLVCDFSPESPAEKWLVYPLAGTLLGAWAGAIPIALDWDRPWQTWPLTPAFASSLGFVCGTWAASI